MADIEDTIADAAEAPAEVETDGVKIKEHSLPDLIQVANHQAANAGAAKGKTRGLRFTKQLPPGSV